MFFNTKNPEDETRELEKLHESQTVPSYEKLPDIPYTMVPLMLSGLDGEFKDRLKFVKEYVGRFNGYIMDESEARGIMGNMYDDWDQLFNKQIPGDEMLRMKYSGQEGMVPWIRPRRYMCVPCVQKGAGGAVVLSITATAR